jgi:hypothetical protein
MIGFKLLLFKGHSSAAISPLGTKVIFKGHPRDNTLVNLGPPPPLLARQVSFLVK